MLECYAAIRLCVHLIIMVSVFACAMAMFRELKYVWTVAGAFMVAYLMVELCFVYNFFSVTVNYYYEIVAMCAQIAVTLLLAVVLVRRR